MDEFPFLEVTMGILILMYLFQTMITLRQHNSHQITTIPEPLVGIISPARFADAREYCLAKGRLHMIREFDLVILDCGILYFKLIPWLWEKCGESILNAGLNPEDELLHSLVFFGAVVLWKETTTLPFFVIENLIDARHGYSTTLREFFHYKMKFIAFAMTFGPPTVAAALMIEQEGGPRMVAIFVRGCFFVHSLMIFSVYPVHFAPLFARFTLLERGRLRRKISQLAASMQFPLKEIYVVIGSPRFNNSSAFTYGFFKHDRIVLDEALVRLCQDDRQILAVVVRELGNWKLIRDMYDFITQQILILLQVGGFLLIRESKELYESFGFHDSQPLAFAVIVFMYTVAAVLPLATFAANSSSRCCEFQADAFAKQLGYGRELQESLIKTHGSKSDTLGSMNADPWFSAYARPFPTLVERLEELNKID